MLTVTPAKGPLEATVRLPGSKSLTNRALVTAALARGTSVLSGVLVADDTLAMMDGLRALGAGVELDQQGATAVVSGTGGAVAMPVHPRPIDARQSGTTARFLLPVVALGNRWCTVDGEAQLRSRPMGPMLDALGQLGADARSLGPAGRLPIAVRGPARGGIVEVAGDASSQFASGLLLAGAAMERGVRVGVRGGMVSRPYVEMTISVMRSFGADARWEGDELYVPGTGYEAASYMIEPDASAASYFFAAAAIAGGSVRVEGLGLASLQGDMGFVGVLEAMGAEVERSAGATVVRRAGELRGIEVDMADISDTVPSLAVVAATATGPTTINGVGFIRAKESNRITATVTELCRLGIPARETPNGLTIEPSRDLRPGVVRTYGDHRIAMSFALLGLVTEGITIEGPGCVAKTFPGYFDALAALAPAGQ